MWPLIVISCLSMIVKDLVSVLGIVAEAKGNERLSGDLNPLGTVASILFYNAGTAGLIHDYGWIGYLGLIPVLMVDYVDGRFFTAVSRYIKSDESSGDAGLRDIMRGFRVVGGEWLHTITKACGRGV